jgi:3-hydroxyacyl-CoA dehydrogenase
MNFANVGMPVTIVETTQEALDRGLAVIRRNYEATAKRGRMTADEVEKRVNLIKGSLALGDLAQCDLVIEAIFENMAVKKEVFAKLDQIVKSGAILATNTSALDIDEIATAVKRPEAVIGLHFFSPANVMRLLEVVRAKETSKAVIATSMQLAKRIGKIGVLVGVCPGFVGNRMLFMRQHAAQQLLLEGVMPWDIDRVLYDFGMPMGPFAMADLAGLDIGWSKETSKGESLRDILCELDRRGQKTNAGYYDYDENRNAKPSPVVEKIIKEYVAKHGGKTRAIADQEILERCIYPMINEGAKILEEGKAIRPSDIDIVWINGYGWPAYRGGPMYYGDQVGLDKVLGKLRIYEGPSFKPSALLERLVAEGKKFSQ